MELSAPLSLRGSSANGEIMTGLCLIRRCRSEGAVLLSGGGGKRNKLLVSKQTPSSQEIAALGATRLCLENTETQLVGRLLPHDLAVVRNYEWRGRLKQHRLVWKDDLVRLDVNEVNDYQDSTYHRDRRVARLRRKCEDCCCSNRATRGRGHD